MLVSQPHYTCGEAAEHLFAEHAVTSNIALHNSDHIRIQPFILLGILLWSVQNNQDVVLTRLACSHSVALSIYSIKPIIILHIDAGNEAQAGQISPRLRVGGQA